MTTLSTRAISVKVSVELTEALQNMTNPTNIKFNSNELKYIQNLSTLFIDIAAGKVFESMSDKQLKRVGEIFPDNRMKKHNNSPDG